MTRRRRNEFGQYGGGVCALLMLLTVASVANSTATRSSAATAASDCDCRSVGRVSWKRVVSRCYWWCWWQLCPQWADTPPLTHAQRVLTLLQDQLFGQEYATEKIVAAMRGRRHGQPLSMHFVGENGVGKTLAARLVGQALYQLYDADRGVHRGELYMRGSSYRAVNATQAAVMGHALRDRILTYLHTCPHSLIIVDEVELLHAGSVASLQPLLDVQNFPFIELGATRVFTANASFIFISDFGAEGITQEDSLDDILTRIRFETDKIWGDSKYAALIQHTIPFLPLAASTRGPIHMIHRQLRLLSSLEHFQRWKVPVDASLEPRISQSDRDALTQFVLQRALSPLFRNDNYRAIPKIFNQHVESAIVAKAEEFASTESAVGFNKNVVLQLALSFDAQNHTLRVTFAPVHPQKDQNLKEEL